MPRVSAVYAGVRASYDIEALEPIVGRLPRRINRLVLEWSRLHQDELLLNWRLLRSGQDLVPIDPCDELSTLVSMNSTPDVLEAKPTEGCKIWLRWADGLAAEVDFSYLLDYDGVWLPLRDPEFFDICPDTLYAETREAAGVAA